MKRLLTFFIAMSIILASFVVPASADVSDATFEGDLLRMESSGWLTGVYQTGGLRIHYNPACENQEGNFLEVKDGKLYVSTAKDKGNTCLQFDFPTEKEGIVVLSADIMITGNGLTSSKNSGFGGVYKGDGISNSYKAIFTPYVENMRLISDNGQAKLPTNERFMYTVAVDIDSGFYNIYINGGIVSKDNTFEKGSFNRWQFNIETKGELSNSAVLLEFDNVSLRKHDKMPADAPVKMSDEKNIYREGNSFLLAPPDCNNTIYEESVGFMAAVGVVSKTEDFLPRSNMTRGELVDLLVKFYKYEGLGERKVPFGDVPKNHPYFDSISAAYSAGLINGDINGNFHPDDFVSKIEALALVIRAIGFGTIAETNGGYPNGYYNVAKLHHLLFDYNIDQEPVTKGDFADLMFATLDVAMLTNIVGKSAIEEETVIRKIFKGSRIYGYVSANCQDSLYGDKMAKGKIEITDESGNCIVYDCGDIEDVDAIALPVVAYLIKERNGQKIVFIHPRQTAEKLELDASQLSPDDQNYGLYNVVYDKNGRNVNATVKKSAVFFYNGRVTNDIKKVDICINNGGIILIDTDGDRIYDIVKITKYESKIISSVDNKNNIFFTDGSELLADEERIITLVRKNRIQTIDKLAQNDCVMISKSKNGDYVNIFAETGKKRLGSNTITSIRTNGNVYSVENGAVVKLRNYEITAGNQIYKYSAEYLFSSKGSLLLKVGIPATVYLNVAGEIVDVDFDDVSRQYGYLIGIGRKDTFDTGILIKLFTTDNLMRVFEVNTSVLLNNEKRVKEMLLLSQENGLVDSVGDVIRQPVNYELTTDGEIRSIGLCENKLTTGTVQYVKVGNVSALKESSSVIGEQMIADITDAVVFSVPQNGVDDGYVTVAPENLNATRNYSAVELYDMDDMHKAGVVVITGGKGTAISSFKYMLVTEIEYTRNENNDDVMRISGNNLASGAVDTVITSVNSNWENLSEGQILIYALDNEGSAVKENIYSIDENTVQGMLYKRIGDSNAFCVANFKRFADNMLIYSLGGENTFPIPVAAGVTVTEYNKATKKFDEYPMSKLLENQKIFMFVNGLTVRKIVVFKD